MPIEPNQENDLDRTDELPRLDVEAYEAAAAADSSILASTDTWTVQSLRDIAADDAEAGDAPLSNTAQLRRKPAPTAAPIAADVMLDAGRILTRISQLEAELGAVRTQSREFQERSESLAQELAMRDTRVAALTADNERLREQQSIGVEKVQTLQAQLEAQAVSFDVSLREVQSAREAQAAAALAEKLSLEQRLTSAQAQQAQLQSSQQQLQGQLRAEAELARTRADSIEQLQQELTEEQRKAAQMARYLATKLVDSDALAISLKQREDVIASLQAARDGLAGDLQFSQEEAAQRLIRLEAAELTLDELRSEQGKRKLEMQEQERKIAQLTTDLARTVAEFGATAEERNASAIALAAERKEHETTRRTLAERVAHVERLQSEARGLQARIQTLEAEIEKAAGTTARQQEQIGALELQLGDGQRQVEALTQELSTTRTRIAHLEIDARELIAAQGELATRAGELQSAQETEKTLRADIDSLRERSERQTKESQAQSELLRNTQQELAELQGANASAQEALVDTRATVAKLEAEAARQSERLKTLGEDLEAARLQIEQQTPALQELEQAVRARDTLAGTLRAELQTAQDERAIVTTHLEKARARNKKLAHEIFQRDKQIAALKQDLAVHAETLAVIRQDINRVGAPEPAFRGQEPDRILEPLGHDSPAIVLNRKVVTVGRTSDNDACIPSKLVSRHHARLLVGPNAVIVEDAGSTNGCYVNDKLVKQQLMRDGDVLSLGDLRYRLCTRPARTPRARDNVISIVDGQPAAE